MLAAQKDDQEFIKGTQLAIAGFKQDHDTSGIDSKTGLSTVRVQLQGAPVVKIVRGPTRRIEHALHAVGFW
jgi:hypothetical protein